MRDMCRKQAEKRRLIRDKELLNHCQTSTIHSIPFSMKKKTLMCTEPLLYLFFETMNTFIYGHIAIGYLFKFAVHCMSHESYNQV
jgi:cyanate lyase